jgi:hypothetical protein
VNPLDPPGVVRSSRVGFVCAHCGVYEREERFDGYNHFTVCAQCGEPELRISAIPGKPRDRAPRAAGADWCARARGAFRQGRMRLGLFSRV